MTIFIHHRSLTANHIARSIIITADYRRPQFMNTEALMRNSWPTPAMKTYKRVVSIEFSSFFWKQDSITKKMLLMSISRELFHEGGGRIYKRASNASDILVKQSVEYFQQMVKKRLQNLRYKQDSSTTQHDYDSLLDSFTEGEKVMVESMSSLNYEGTFQFNSIINSDFCYIQFDSRTHIIRWKKSLVKHIDLTDNSGRRITRSMTKRQRIDNLTSNTPVGENEEIHQDANHDDETSVARSNVARATSVQEFGGDDVPGGFSYENLIAMFGNGMENKSSFDEGWLTKKGFVENSLRNHQCYICLNYVDHKEVVYNIKCGDEVKHPLHRDCAQRYVASKGTNCPGCRFDWE